MNSTTIKMLSLALALVFAGTVGCEQGAEQHAGTSRTANSDHAHDDHDDHDDHGHGHAHGDDEPDWCLEHGLPESVCTKCSPSLVEHFRAEGDYCEEHGYPESACPFCNPITPPPELVIEAIEARVVYLPSPDLEALTGFETIPSVETSVAPAIECTARIAFNDNAVADVRAIVPGIVRGVHVELGDEIEEGAALFDLVSTQVGEIQGSVQTARERLRGAQANLERQQQLRERELNTAQDVRVAEREVTTARVELQTAQATLRLIGASDTMPSGRYSLAAPISGTVVRRPAVLGVLATESESLATIADTSQMWALCDVPESQVARVERGQPVSLWLAGEDDETLTGEITWISSEVNPRTRTLSARAVINNEHGRLRANQFARARIETEDSRVAVSVPREAVQRFDEHELVFVRTAQGVYEPRVVERFGDGERVQVRGRLEAGDQVVTTGAILLRTEIMPGSIGAGCCEVTPPGAR